MVGRPISFYRYAQFDIRAPLNNEDNVGVLRATRTALAC